MNDKYIKPGILGVLILISFISCKQNYDDLLTSSLVKKNYVPVEVEPIESVTARIPIYAIGRISSDTETQLSFKTGGFISGLFKNEGDYVHKGNLLGTLRTQEIDAQVLKAQRALEKAQRDLVRIEKMYADSVATLENVEDLKTLVAVSQADFEIAKYNQEYSKIVSPISGRVLQRLAEPNELVSPGQPIYVIASSQGEAYIMTIHISDKDIAQIGYHTTAEIVFDAFPKEIFNGKVKRINESADLMTGTFEIDIALHAGIKRLRNGLIGRVTLFHSDEQEFLKIPIASVAEGSGDEIVVYVPDSSDTIAIKHRLRVGRFADEFVWATTDQLSEKRIITLGSAYLKDGQIIKITNSQD